MLKRKGGVVTYDSPAKRRYTQYGRYPAVMYKAPPRAPIRNVGYRPNPTELKVFDTAVAAYAVNTTGLVGNICLPVVGADFNQRVGRKILIKSVYIRGRIALAASDANALIDAPSQLGRIILLWDKQPNGALPSVSDILTSATATAQFNINSRDRFKILKDKQWAFGYYNRSTTATQTYAVADNVCFPIKIYKKLNLETIFNGSAGTIADISSGSLVLFFIGTEASGTNQGAQATISIRVRYKDN